MATYPVRGVGIAAAIGVSLTTLLYVLAVFVPAVVATRVATTAGEELTRTTAGVTVLLSVPFLLAYLCTAALVMTWMYRARKNTDAFPGRPSQLAAHWAVTGWFVPVASLVVPCAVLAGVVRDSLGRVRLRALVALWWVGWLVLVAGDLVSRLGAMRPDVLLARSGATPGLDHYRDAALRGTVPAAACLVAGVSLIVLIFRISAAQQARIAPDAPAGPDVPTAAAQPPSVTAPSPMVATEPTPVSPAVAPTPGGTIGA